MSGILDQVKAQTKANIDKLTPEQIKERLAKVEAQRATQREAMKTRNANLTPEQKAARAAKHKEYQAKNPDKFKAQRAAYNARPEVAERRKAYMKKRQLEAKFLRERAKELGISVTPTPSVDSGTSQNA